MSEENNPWKARFERERKSRKESELLLEEKSLELWKANQELEEQVKDRTESLEKALIETQKAHRAKSDFLANMSHEIRTPLNAIIGFSQVLSNSEDLNEQNNKYASIIESSATSLLSIINDILDFSKIESGNFEISKEECDIFKICNGVVDLFTQKTDEKHIKLNYFIDESIPKFIITDATRIRQVLSNLLSNAVKFTNERGEIFLNIYLLESKESNITIKFEVEDTGIGIPENKQKDIFNPFIQVDHVSNKHNVGTGLGLSICNNILKLLDTKLQLESEIGKGSKFSFILNTEVSKNLSILEEQEQTNTENIETLEGKVLVAEDNLANQELMRLVLKDLGLTATIVSNGQEAIDMYSKDSSFELILMDINMPLINGIEAFFLIRDYEDKNNLEKTPVIALTANAIKGDKERFLSLGMDNYLSKPINMNEFKQVASKYLKFNNKNSSSNKDEVTTKKFDIEKISKNLAISENICQILVDNFMKTIKDDLEELKDYSTKEDSLNIQEKAHYIKNSCLNLQLEEEINLLQEIESNNKDINLVRKNVQRLEELLL